MGKLPALAGTARTNLPLVCVDYLAAFLTSVPTREETLGQDLVVLDQETPALPQLIEMIADHLGVNAPTRILSPKLLARIPKAISGVEAESLLFLTEDQYDTQSAQEHAQAVGLLMPEIKVATLLWADYLVATEFGRKPMAESAHLIGTTRSRTFVRGELETADTVVLHGLPWDGESFDPLSTHLAGASAIPDLPGLGRSSKANHEDTSWVESLLCARKEPVHLIGHSYSTELALHYVNSHPEMVSGLVLISPYFLQKRAPWYMRWAPLTRQLFRFVKGKSLASQLLVEPGKGSVHPAVQSAHLQLSRPGVRDRIARILSEVSGLQHRVNVERLLESTKVPTLIIHGAADPLVTLPKHGKVVCIDEAGHSPHLDRPELVAQAIEEWMGRMGADPALSLRKNAG